MAGSKPKMRPLRRHQLPRPQDAVAPRVEPASWRHLPRRLWPGAAEQSAQVFHANTLTEWPVRHYQASGVATRCEPQRPSPADIAVYKPTSPEIQCSGQCAFGLQLRQAMPNKAFFAGFALMCRCLLQLTSPPSKFCACFSFYTTLYLPRWSSLYCKMCRQFKSADLTFAGISH